MDFFYYLFTMCHYKREQKKQTKKPPKEQKNKKKKKRKQKQKQSKPFIAVLAVVKFQIQSLKATNEVAQSKRQVTRWKL